MKTCSATCVKFTRMYKGSFTMCSMLVCRLLKRLRLSVSGHSLSISGKKLFYYLCQVIFHVPECDIKAVECEV